MSLTSFDAGLGDNASVGESVSSTRRKSAPSVRSHAAKERQKQQQRHDFEVKRRWLQTEVSKQRKLLVAYRKGYNEQQNLDEKLAAGGRRRSRKSITSETAPSSQTASR
jgi:primosomal protein N''